MDQNIQKALWLGVGVMMFIAVVSTGLFLFNKGRGVAEASGEQIDSMSRKLSMVEYSKFDNMIVNGEDVINAIKEYKNESGKFLIEVHTSYPSVTQYVSTGSVSANVLSGALVGKARAVTDGELLDVLDSTTATYINPHGEFLSQLIYDANEDIKGIIVIQQ